MDINEFLVTILENVVATIPALAVIASPLIYGLKKIREVTSTFPNRVEETKNVLQEKFNQTSDVLQEKVNGSLLSMKEELASYKNELIATKEQANMLVKQNKVYMDTLSELVGQDPNLIKNGLATKISTKFKMTNEELLKFPEKLMADNNLLEKAMLEAKNVLGEENYNKLLAKVNGQKV
jgi:hypothetical protein